MFSLTGEKELNVRLSCPWKKIFLKIVWWEVKCWSPPISSFHTFPDRWTRLLYTFAVIYRREGWSWPYFPCGRLSLCFLNTYTASLLIPEHASKSITATPSPISVFKNEIAHILLRHSIKNQLSPSPMGGILLISLINTTIFFCVLWNGE